MNDYKGTDFIYGEVFWRNKNFAASVGDPVEDFADSEFNSCDGGVTIRWNNSSQFDLIEAY